jgi:hypothetical protein
MADKYHGYDGGESEEALIAALRELLNEEEGDTITKIKTKYWPTGHAIEIAKAKGYIQKMGLKGWMFHNFQRSETHARDCLTAWQCRRQFDDAYKWWKSGNTNYMPQKLSGPRFCVDLCKAYEKRLEAPAPRRKGPTAKQLRAVIAAYRSGFGRLKTEHVQWAEEDQRASRVLTVIEQEIEEAEAEIATGTDGDGQWPLNATRDGDIEDEADDNSDEAGEADEEADKGDETPDDTTEDNTDADNTIPDTEHTQGEGFVVIDKIAPPKRAARPRGFRRDVAVAEQPKKRGPGRPKGSKNKPKSEGV